MVPAIRVPVTTVPNPFMVNTRSMGNRISASASRACTSTAAVIIARFNSSSPAPVRELTATMACPSRKLPRRNSSTSIRTRSSVSASTASAFVITAIPRRTPNNCRMSKCSRVCGMIDSSAAITSSTRSMPPTPASMLRTNLSCPGTSTNPSRSVSPLAAGKSMCANPRSMVMPRRFSSSSRSASIPVRAFTSAVFPWSMCPAVPTMIDFIKRIVAGEILKISLRRPYPPELRNATIEALPMATSLTSAFSPETLRQHGLTPDEFEKIKQLLGQREPTLTELGIFSVMWSEHCSYKSSRVHLKRLPTRSKLVLQGPGENAGIIDIGEGWACAFKIESHNHPSFIEPFQGATTGVGGILRDIFTMGARPVAVMDSLRFGPITGGVGTAALGRSAKVSWDQKDIHKNHAILEGVVSGVASYGNCFGVPNLGGETKFEPCYSGNPLVNAFAIGLVRKDEIFYARAAGEGNPVIYVGAKTGRDGIHGATMASEEFSEASEAKRPNVQVGDPFLEKLLLEACLEAMRTGAIVGIQDMGAAG